MEKEQSCYIKLADSPLIANLMNKPLFLIGSTVICKYHRNVCIGIITGYILSLSEDSISLEYGIELSCG